jgi:hypothetical protein
MNALMYGTQVKRADNCTLLKAEMRRCRLTEFDMARQLGVSILMLRQYLQNGYGPQYIESRVADWLE